MSANVHGTAVALDAQRAVLILGASGAGKSLLALRLMALGAHLVADDRVDLQRDGEEIRARPPEALVGRIEARGIGILCATPLWPARIVLIADLDRMEPERLPRQRFRKILGVKLPLVSRVQHDHLDVTILQWLKGGRWV